LENLALFVSENFYKVFLILLGVYVVIKIRNRHSDQKRKVYFSLAVGVFLVYTGAIFPVEGKLPYWILPVIMAAVAAGLIFYISRIWPFRLSCGECGGRLNTMTVLGDDRNLCASCLALRDEAGSSPAAADAEQESGVPEERDSGREEGDL